MSYPTLAVANFLLELAQTKGVGDITPMKLQKLVYYANGWNLGATDEPLIHEQVEAWRYGPVIETIYCAAKQYGNQPITAPLRNNTAVAFGDSDCPELTKSDKDAVRPLLNWILEQYGDLTGIQLSNLTHREEEPWYKIYQQRHGGSPPHGTDIDTGVIRDYFAAEVSKLEEQSV